MPHKIYTPKKKKLTLLIRVKVLLWRTWSGYLLSLFIRTCSIAFGWVGVGIIKCCDLLIMVVVRWWDKMISDHCSKRQPMRRTLLLYLTMVMVTHVPRRNKHQLWWGLVPVQWNLVKWQIGGDYLKLPLHAKCKGSNLVLAGHNSRHSPYKLFPCEHSQVHNILVDLHCYSTTTE